MAKVLTIEKKGEIQALVSNRLSKTLSVDTVADIGAIPHKSGETAYDMIVWDLGNSNLEGSRGLEWLELLQRDSPQTRVIVISHDGRISDAGRLKNENYQFIRWPIDANQLCAFIKSVLEHRPVIPRDTSHPEVRVPFEIEGILVGTSLAMREIVQRIMEAASADITVLITGETGTGKDLVAAAIHKRSHRKQFPYIAVNTGAMSPELIASELFGHEKGSYTGALGTRGGFFEQANNGTIFLDEISTMDEKTQVSLLRVLETKSFRRVGGTKGIGIDVRVIAATNENLEEAIEQKRFREDLYYRLDVLRIHLPPLRERRGAVNFLTDHFVTVFDDLYHKNVGKVSSDTYRFLRHYPWPGNIRELKSVVQCAVLKAPGAEFTPDLLPARIRESGKSDAQYDGPRMHAGMTLKAAEKELVKLTLAFTGGNKKAAAVMLGISRRAFYNKLKKYA